MQRVSDGEEPKRATVYERAKKTKLSDAEIGTTIGLIAEAGNCCDRDPLECRQFCTASDQNKYHYWHKAIDSGMKRRN